MPRAKCPKTHECGPPNRGHVPGTGWRSQARSRKLADMTDPRLPEFRTLLLRIEAGVLHVTLNRPERKNALSPAMIDELLETFGGVVSAFGPRAVVLRGAGGTF